MVYIYLRIYDTCMNIHVWYTYWVATISRLHKITGLFCKRALQKRLFSAKETYYLKEPTNRSHPMPKYTLTQTHTAQSVRRGATSIHT